MTTMAVSPLRTQHQPKGLKLLEPLSMQTPDWEFTSGEFRGGLDELQEALAYPPRGSSFLTSPAPSLSSSLPILLFSGL